jgi:spore coat polysaccharide biosynthesis protein SpsF (cytidylyltransferase family)
VIAAFAQEHGFACYRGLIDDVATRVLDAGRSAGADAIVRVNGDSPLLDPALVDHAVDLFRREQVDLVTNVWPRTFPKGQSVEVISYAALARATVDMTTDSEQEHVTTIFYTCPERWTIRSFTTERPRPELQLSVDNVEDLRRCESILADLGKPHWEAGWEACSLAADRFAGTKE